MNLSKLLYLFFLFIVSVSFSQSLNVDSLKTLAENGNKEAILRLHEYYLLEKRIPDSVKYWTFKAAELKIPEGLYWLGIGYFRGMDGFPRKIHTGLKYLHAAADSGNSLAALRLMEIYGDTSSSPFIDPAYKKLRNKKKAFKFAKQAAEAGHPDAIYYLAHAYLQGNGTQKNDSLAILWMKKLADNYNNAQAQLDLANWFFYAKTQYGINNPEAEKYYKKVAENRWADPELKAWGRVGLYNLKILPDIALYLTYTPFYLWLPEQFFFDVNW